MFLRAVAGASEFRIADLQVHSELLAAARDDAALILDRDPELDKPEHRLLRRKLMHAYGGALGLVDVA